MNNPTTIDRRDVADPTNPIGGQGHVEEINRSNAALPPDETNPGRLDQLRAEGRRTPPSRSTRRHIELQRG